MSQGPSIDICVLLPVRTYVFLLLYPCRYTIYGLLLNYDSSTQARLSFYTSRQHTRVAIIWLIHTTYVLQQFLQMQNKHACLIVKNYDSLTERTSILRIFCRHGTRLPYNQKQWLHNWMYILQTFYMMQNETRLVAIEGPWLIKVRTWVYIGWSIPPGVELAYQWLVS